MDNTFTINGIIIGSYWYDVEHEKMLFYTTFGKLTAEISMSQEQYCSLCQNNQTLEAIWNTLADLFGDKEITLENNKKKNMAYWDTIDEACCEAVRGVAASSQTEIDDDELEDTVIEIGAEIRDIIVEKLKAIGGVFPFIDENY